MMEKDMTFLTSLKTHHRFSPDADQRYRQWRLQAELVATGIGAILKDYQPISLNEMEGVALLNRTDTKFVLHVDQLAQVLQHLGGQYRVLEISHRRLHAYHNIYFETPNFTLFDQHHRGQRDRFKVRCRQYVDSGLNYLEIKRKNNLNRTIKSRLKTIEFVEDLSPYHAEFLQDYYPYSPHPLAPVLWNDFQRMTLVSTQSVERLTLDINLGFSNGWNQMGLPGIAVAEVKQDGFSIHSDFMAQMRSWAIPPQRFSKYCMGVTLFYPDIKANYFKPRTMLVDRLIQMGA